MNSPTIDPTTLVPGLTLPELACFAAVIMAVVCPTGHALRCLAGLDVDRRIERWALTGTLGVLWTSILYFLLGVFGSLDLHLFVVWLPVVFWLWRRKRRIVEDPPSDAAPSVNRDRAAGIVGGLLVTLFVVGYLGQVVNLVHYDRDGLRLYGAFFSDKLAGTATCAALMHEVPPRNLQFSGQTSFTHYFPRVFVAASCRPTGIDFVNGFWFYAAALGVALEGLAILAFCRRLFGSYWFGCLALVLHGLLRYTAEQKPLDLSFAMLLLGLLALDRCGATGRRRWGILAVFLFGAMPTYEIFHAATVCAGLLVWWTLGVTRLIYRRRSSPANTPTGRTDVSNGNAQTKRPVSAWRDIRFRTLIAWPACLLAFAAIRMLASGSEVSSPPEFVAQNSYRDSYKHEWQDLLRESAEEHPVLATVYHWKRGKPFGARVDRDSASVDKPGPLKRLAGKLAYELGFAGYFSVRFLNVAVFGCVALVLWFKKGPGTSMNHATICGAAGSISLVGMAIPFLITMGHHADDQWWETPNIYRFTTLAGMLLVLTGTGLIVEAARQWRRPVSWLAGGIVVARIGYLLIGVATPATQFTLVNHDRLEALAFLRTEVPFGQIVLHPWCDDLIRDTGQPDRVSWTYDDHFMLGANLAGQQMYFEGKPDHAFSTGHVTPDEVFQRVRLRTEFYQPDHRSAVEELIGPAGVAWVVADTEHPPPPRVANHWQTAFKNASVKIFRKPDN